GDGARVRLRLRALTPDATGILVRERLGSAATQEVCRACHLATAGNPYLVGELLASLPVTPPSGDLVARVGAVRVDAIARHVTARLDRLGHDCRSLAEALAVLGRMTPLRHAARVAGL